METDPGLIRFMLNPAHYPDPSSRITHLETHISHVFLCDDFVYKLKKPVDFGFLDFTTLRKRRFFCEQEVTLNSRLAGDTYLGVGAIYRKGEEYSLSDSGGGRVAEYYVKMKRIPLDCLLFSLIEEGRPLYGRLEPVGRRLALFHKGARVYRGARYGAHSTVVKATEENFAQIAPYREETISGKFFEQLVEYTREFLKDKKAEFSLRKRRGLVREGHGDLHTQHICLADPPIIFDCIEFNESFRVIDVLEDIAFLFMDMEYRARFDLSSTFLKTYFAHNEESMNEDFLRFFKVYRAVVRGKVEGFRARGLSDAVEKEKGLRDAREYFHLAEYYLNYFKRPFNPVVFMGLSGTGKSAIARDFSANWLILRSDEMRKTMSGLGKGEHRYLEYGEGIYSDALTRGLYCALVERTVDHALRGERVVVDATFLKKDQRRNFYETCMEKGLNPFFVHCFADESVLRDRITRRMEEGADVSDAHMGILDRQIRDMEEPGELPCCRVLRLNTEEKLHNIIRALKEFL
jgi:uncharacterized protein